MAAVNPRTEYRGIQWVPSARKSSTRFASASVPKAASSTLLIESWSSCEFSRSLRVLHKWPVRDMLSLLPLGLTPSRPGEPRRVYCDVTHNLIASRRLSYTHRHRSERLARRRWVAKRPTGA